MTNINDLFKDEDVVTFHELQRGWHDSPSRDAGAVIHDLKDQIKLLSRWTVKRDKAILSSLVLELDILFSRYDGMDSDIKDIAKLCVTRRELNEQLKSLYKERDELQCQVDEMSKNLPTKKTTKNSKSKPLASSPFGDE